MDFWSDNLASIDQYPLAHEFRFKFFLRCSLIEPGPVTTSFAANAKLPREGIDTASADEKTQALLKDALKEMYRTVTSNSQAAEEIASIIKSVLLSPVPHLRYLHLSWPSMGQERCRLSSLIPLAIKLLIL